MRGLIRAGKPPSVAQLQLRPSGKFPTGGALVNIWGRKKKP